MVIGRSKLDVTGSTGITFSSEKTDKLSREVIQPTWRP